MDDNKKSIFEGYESYIYLEEKDSRQLYILKTWYEKATYAQAVTSQAEVIKSFEDNPFLVVISGRIEGVLPTQSKTYSRQRKVESNGQF